MGCGCGGSKRPRRIVGGRSTTNLARPRVVPRTLAQRTQGSKSATHHAMGKLAIQKKRKTAIRRALGRP